MKSQPNEKPLEHASVRQYCKAVRMPAIAANFVSLAEQAVKENHSHIRYLEALLAMEMRRAGPACDREPDSRCAIAAHENAGRVRLRAGAADSSGEDSRVGGRRLYRTQRTGGADRRMRHG